MSVTLCWIVLGGAINLGATQLIVLYVAAGAMDGTLSSKHTDLGAGPWPVPVPSDWPRPALDRSIDRLRFGIDESFQATSFTKDTYHDHPGATTRGLFGCRAGWPCFSFAGWCEQTKGPGRRTELRYRFWPPVGDMFRLPLSPLWTGLALNTLFYAAFAWCFWQVPLTLRRRSRRRAGRCTTCGYDLSATPAGSPCPECGHSSPASATPIQR